MATRSAGRSLLLLVCIVTQFPGLPGSPDCVSSASRTVRFSTRSHRNLTGHWMTQMSVSQTTAKGISGLALHYDVDVTRSQCGDKDTVTTAFSITVPPPRVGSDYTFFPGVGFYKLHTKGRIWSQAFETCAEEGAHLAVVDSAEEENAIRQVIDRHTQEKFWAFIGFHDMLEEGKYVTIFGKPLGSTWPARWADGEPSNRGKANPDEDEDCGSITNDGSFHDLQCAVVLPFICEQQIS